MREKDDIVKIFILAVLYYLLGIFSMSNSVENSIVTISAFFSEGVALAFVLKFGPKMALGVFLGQLFLALGAFDVLSALTIAISNSIEAILAYFVFNYFGFNLKLNSLKDVYILIAVIVLILQPFSAFFGTISLYFYHLIKENELVVTALSWYFGNTIGQLLVTPALLYLFSNYKSINIIKATMFSLLFVILFYIFVVIVSIQNITIIFSITIIPLVLLLSHRNGLGYALISIVTLTLVAIYTFREKVGIFSKFSEIDNIININFYILSHIIIVLVIGVLIGEKNRAVDRYKTLNQVLEERVAKEVAQNREKDKIMFFQSRLAQIGETISMIAHQWRQPLNNLSIINQSIYLRYKKGSLDEKRFEQLYRSSSDVIKMMTDTIEDFSNFFKPDREKERFSINKNIDDLLKLINEEYKNLNIKIIKEEFSDFEIEGYKNEFSQVVLIILENAKHALIQNNIADKKIIIKTISVENRKILSIEDNANGIESSLLDKIFEPYFSTKHKQGTGLGLYMAKTILEEHMSAKIVAKNGTNGAVFEIMFS